MLSRAERLTTREFARVFETSRTLRHPLLQLRYARRGDLGDKSAVVSTSPLNVSVRAAFAVSKKLGKATVRNRVRRRVREIYRLSSWRSDSRLGGYDLIFFANASTIAASNEEIRAALDEILARLVSSGARPNQPRSGQQVRSDGVHRASGLRVRTYSPGKSTSRQEQRDAHASREKTADVQRSVQTIAEDSGVASAESDSAGTDSGGAAVD
ncbi:MAG TPA: ribonuclease P protein component [Abditibacteriaceae bacterium]|jgi:ribonuclease P protein component